MWSSNERLALSMKPREDKVIDRKHVCLILIIYSFRDEAEMEYLKIAQDLDMYGVSYFSITVSHHLI